MSIFAIFDWVSVFILTVFWDKLNNLKRQAYFNGKSAILFL